MVKQLGPPIGKIGGQEVNEITINHPDRTGPGFSTVAELPIPPGITAKIIMVMTTSESTNTNASQCPKIHFANTAGTGYDYSTSTTQPWGVSFKSVGPMNIWSERRASGTNSTVAFTGFIYWWIVE